MSNYIINHLRELESEAIFVIREIAAQFENPVLLFSGGKDSILLTYLAKKAFYPAKIPFPLIHVDTGHNFPETIAFRDALVEKLGVKLIVGSVQDAIDKGRVKEETGADASRNALQIVSLLDTLEAHKVDAAMGGARRDEEKARAKERFFSHRDEFGQWDPKNQRAELWSLYNSRINKGESIRVFPLSNWTELDIWHYILREQIPIVPLYFAAPRPVVQQDGTLIMVDDDRMPLDAGNPVRVETVRFRTLGCYPLTGAIPSAAATVEDIILELLASRHSEREGRVIDRDQHASMEDKKREGYF